MSQAAIEQPLPYKNKMAWDRSTQDDKEWNNCILYRLIVINSACFAEYSVFLFILLSGRKSW